MFNLISISPHCSQLLHFTDGTNVAYSSIRVLQYSLDKVAIELLWQRFTCQAT